MTAKPTICLSMIVRDEAHVVAETLAGIAARLDYWVVVDTGSSDATEEVVRSFFAERGLPGELHRRPWRDFGTNRTEALELCRGKADYAWVIDADDVVVGDLDLTRLTADVYHLRYGDDFVYWRPQLFRLGRAWRYEGVVHEYPAWDDPDVDVRRLEGDYHLLSRRLGARSRTADTYARDAAALGAVVAADPEDSRSVFYLAQSLRDAGDLPGALRWYTRRGEMGGWDQERCYALLERARLLERLDHPWSEVLEAYLGSWAARPTRAEPLYEIARHYRLADEFALGHLFAAQAASLPFPDSDTLFVAADVYRWRARDEQSISGYYVGRFRESLDLCTSLLSGSALPENERDRIEQNRDFAVERLRDELSSYPTDVVGRLGASRTSARIASVTLTITTCRRLHLFEQTMNSFLHCCEDVESIDRWICIDDGSAPADRDRMQERYPFFEFVWKPADDRGHASSMNRLAELVDTPYWLHLEDDWQFVVPKAYVTESRVILDEDPSIGQVLFNRNYGETLADRAIPGGLVRTTRGGLRYRAHQHLRPDTDEYRSFFAALPAGSAANVWWPHFSLRPSLLRTAAVHAVGEFNEGSEHFELDFANRWAADGHASVFLDAIHCLHRGPLTTDRGPTRRPNAYDLNQVPQFRGGVAAERARVYVTASWTTSSDLCARWERMSRGGGVWDDIELVADGAGADYVAVVNFPPPGQRVPPDRTVVFQMEPQHAVDGWGVWAAPDDRAFLQVRGHDRYPNNVEWHLSLRYDELRDRAIHKTKELSSVTSGRIADHGQRLRLAFLHHLEAHDVPIDIYGRDNSQRFRSYRGPLPPYAKDDGILPYRYTLAAENTAEPNYFTEKIVDAILGEALCFYWGCPNLEDYFDPDSFIRLPLDDLDASRRIVADAISSQAWAERIDVIRAQKQRILDEYQVFPTLARVVHGARFRDTLDTRVVNLDRRPDRLESFLAAAEQTAGPVAGRIRRHPAVDGATLTMTDELANLFRGNDFGFRRSIIGCALSHLAIWREVAAGPGCPCLVLEDDARFVPGFPGLLVEVCGQLRDREPGFDVAFLGYHSWRGPDAHAPGAWHAGVEVAEMDWSDYLGGSFGYVVSPDGARRLLSCAAAGGDPPRDRLVRDAPSCAEPPLPQHRAAPRLRAGRPTRLGRRFRHPARPRAARVTPPPAVRWRSPAPSGVRPVGADGA